MKQCNQNISDLIELAKEMLILSDHGDVERNDDSCGVLYGIARDAAYKILEVAEQEKQKHISLEKWG